MASEEYANFDLPSSREDLVRLYSSLNDVANDKFDISELLQLDPKICAALRDRECFNKSPFPSILDVNIEKLLCIGSGSIRWVHPSSSAQAFLSAVGLSNFQLKQPCDRRVKYIEGQISRLSYEFHEEIEFIVNFTTALLWVEPHENQSIGSAAFYEVPHCSFFSDMAIFSIPPEVIVPKQHSGYGILENLYHEALHHQMHVVSAQTNGYLIDGAVSITEIILPWRNRKFNLLEAFHALHVYSLITPLRMKYLKKISSNSQTLTEEHEFIFLSIKDGLKMWRDLSVTLSSHSSQFKSPYSDLINTWKTKYEYFAFSSNIQEIINAG